MDLHEYPRPANDTGIGIHWSAGYAAAVGLSRIRDLWLPQLQALGVKWVKIFNHDGAHDFAQLLLAEGFMPILRIYRPHPNPGHLGVRELVDIDEFIRLGVRYFEFNNEPDQDAEWKGARVPVNGIDLVVEDAIADLEAILERGGMPGIPAVSCGSNWDLVGKIIERGRKDLLDGPVWQAIHNYSRNRPLDYPFDIGNQEGAPFTERFYHVVANEQFNFDPWHGRNLPQINQLRRDYANPGATVNEDNACWLAYEHHNQRNVRHLGHSIPILSTENGYLVGESTDPRYPSTTPELHMAQTLEACRIMMGVSQRYANAPEYYFCTAFTLMANAQLGSNSGWWEGQAWFSNNWAGGMLPIVRALRAEPKVLRTQLDHSVAERAMLHGAVLNLTSTSAGGRSHGGYAGRPVVVLDKGGTEHARTEVDNANQYRFPDLLPGVYTARIDGTELVESVTIHPGESECILNLDLASLAQDIGKSILSGRVRGGADAVVMLVRADDGEEWVNMARSDGSFRFVDLPAGIYNVRVHPQGSHEQGIILDGENSQEVDLAVWGWGYTVSYDVQKPDLEQRSTFTEFVDFEEAGEEGAGGEGALAVETVSDKGTANDHAAGELAGGTISRTSSRATVIRCSVEGYKNVQVHAESSDWQSPQVETGSAPQYGEFACVIDLLSHRTAARNQTYAVMADGVVDRNGQPVALEATVTMQPGHLPTVRFIYQETHLTSATNRSQVKGQVVGGTNSASPIYIKLLDSRAQEQRTLVEQDGSFVFDGLRAGKYSVMLEGHETVAFVAEIGLDGTNEVVVELTLPRASVLHDEGALEQSRIIAMVPHSVGAAARLVDRLGNEQIQIVGTDEYARFENLREDIYTLRIDGGYVETGLEVDGNSGLEIFFSPLITEWKAEVHAAGSMPGFSAVRAEVRGRYDHDVFITKEEWAGMDAKTGSRPDLGEFALEFSPLEPGTYRIAPRGLKAAAEIELTGLEAVWVTFFEQTVPSNPNAVLPLRQGSEREAADKTSGEESNNIGEEQAGQSAIESDLTDTPSESERPDSNPVLTRQDEQNPSQLDLDMNQEFDKEQDFRTNQDFRTDQDFKPTPDSGPTQDFSANQEPERTTPLNEGIGPASTSNEAAPIGNDSLPTLASAAKEAQKAISEYLFIEGASDVNLQKTIDSLIAVLRYVAANQPEVGSNLADARNAERVVVMGQISQAVLNELKAAGVEVEQASGGLVDAYRNL